MQGGVPLDKITEPDIEAVRRGVENLWAHSENLRKHGVRHVIAVNRRDTDTEEELNLVRELCADQGLRVAVIDVFQRGGEGGLELAEAVVELADEGSGFAALYPEDMPLVDKIRTIAREVYGAGDVEFAPTASKQLDELEKSGWGHLLICMAKTQNSITDDKAVLGAPKGFTLHVREVRLSAGAGFVVAYTGNILTMPGFAKRPAAVNVDIDAEGRITGLF